VYHTPDAAITAVNRAFGSTGNVLWRFDRPLRHVDNHVDAAPTIKTFQGATVQTKHFGLVTIDLATGDTRFIDEDHRDGGDFEVERLVLPPDWLEALRAVP
jgi:hypothetical protein